MATVTLERAAVMSIHPQYASAIMQGKKTIEFRKRRLASDISTVWVYATAPIKRIVGSFTIKSTVELTPEAMWKEYGTSGCIDEDAFFAYYQSGQTAIGLLVEEFAPLDRPVLLGEILPSGVPPQSFAYVDNYQWPAAVV
ncbi:hypothetical protein GCM10009551_037580 [Nocardiopsis tropica]|uniref:ASCH domain-containing protein n=1 Tax=Tsukamurella strandjordii TaxID=147577 RepID=UPI0031DC9327